MEEPEPSARSDANAVPDIGNNDVVAPSVTFERLTFSDGNTLILDKDDIVVFVGPNNAGKSAALRELREHIGASHKGAVVKAAGLRTEGTREQLIAFLEKKTVKKPTKSGIEYKGLGFSITREAIESWPKPRAFRSFICRQVATETRITSSNPADAIPTLEQSAAHPIQLLFSDDKSEQRISDYFRRAFDKDLIIFRAGGSKWPLLVGERPELLSGEHIFSTDYNRRLLAATTTLQSQGDGMRSFASVILDLLAPNTPSILLLDEPEAFLHPPQARLLGEFIAKERPKHAQLFIATHSADVLQGLLNVASHHLRVVRIQRDSNINRIKELDKARTKDIGADPLMKFSNVMSGIFYQRVIIGESDADCMFYSALLDLPEVHGKLQPDVLFIHAGGKHRMAALAEALRALDVDVDVIADIDLIREDSALQRIVEALGGDWSEAKAHAVPLRKAIEQHKPWLNAAEVSKGIGEVVAKAPTTGEFPATLRSEIETIFRKASPWDVIKDAGEAAIPPGEATQHNNALQDICRRIGLWIVPVGELEGFCRSVGGHGPRWVQQVIESKDLRSDKELTRAREFIAEVWKRKAKASS